MKVLGLISDHRAYASSSPRMHNAVAKHLGLAYVYVPFVVAPDRVDPAIRGLKALGIAGANVTVPYKETVMPYLDLITDQAKAIGAVNTIVPRNNHLEGHNTDADGFIEVLNMAGFDPKGKEALVLGNGGAAKAVTFALKKSGIAELILAGRNSERVEKTANSLDAPWMTIERLNQAKTKADLVVNTTSISSADEDPVMAKLCTGINVDSCQLIVDVNYGRAQNFWKSMADRLGASFIDGLPMLACQACRSFELWTRRKVDSGLFLAALGIEQ